MKLKDLNPNDLIPESEKNFFEKKFSRDDAVYGPIDTSEKKVEQYLEADKLTKIGDTNTKVTAENLEDYHFFDWISDIIGDTYEEHIGQLRQLKDKVMKHVDQRATELEAAYKQKADELRKRVNEIQDEEEKKEIREKILEYGDNSKDEIMKEFKEIVKETKEDSPASGFIFSLLEIRN